MIEGVRPVRRQCAGPSGSAPAWKPRRRPYAWL